MSGGGAVVGERRPAFHGGDIRIRGSISVTPSPASGPLVSGRRSLGP
jgi:hypothetical protein